LNTGRVYIPISSESAGLYEAGFGVKPGGSTEIGIFRSGFADREEHEYSKACKKIEIQGRGRFFYFLVYD